MGKNSVIIVIDTGDLNGMRKIMEEHGGSKTPFFGENAEGEKIMISVFNDHIVTDTYQKNGWIRRNNYHEDGTSEELFPERWEEPRMTMC